MNTVIGSLLILCILPLSCAWIAGYHRQKQLGSIDNKEPRIQALQLTGAGARAMAAQANSWEALAVFSAAILAVFISGVALQSVANLGHGLRGVAHRLHTDVHRQPGQIALAGIHCRLWHLHLPVLPCAECQLSVPTARFTSPI
jgi:uncharacterized MAPEG superfamily protein